MKTMIKGSIVDVLAAYEFKSRQIFQQKGMDWILADLIKAIQESLRCNEAMAIKFAIQVIEEAGNEKRA